MLKLIELVLGTVAKLLPLLLSFFAGENRVEKKNLEQTIKEGEIRNEIEAEANDMSRSVLVNKLRSLKGNKPSV